MIINCTRIEQQHTNHETVPMLTHKVYKANILKTVFTTDASDGDSSLINATATISHAIDQSTKNIFNKKYRYSD